MGVQTAAFVSGARRWVSDVWGIAEAQIDWIVEHSMGCKRDPWVANVTTKNMASLLDLFLDIEMSHCFLFI